MAAKRKSYAMIRRCLPMGLVFVVNLLIVFHDNIYQRNRSLFNNAVVTTRSSQPQDDGTNTSVPSSKSSHASSKEQPEIPENRAKDAPYEPPASAANARSWEERQKYERSPLDYNITYFRQPKATSSDWWPDRQWIRRCVDEPRNLTAFPLGWYDYRLGDCVKLCKGCPMDEDKDTAPLAHWTIAGEYYDKACLGGKWEERGNETFLDELVNKRANQPGFEKPHPEAVVVHLRLGDKIEMSQSTVFAMLTLGAESPANTFKGHKVVKSLYEILTDIVASGAPRVIIRGGSQFPEFFVKSKTYAYCLQEAAQMAGYETSINLDEANADADFYYMSHASKIIVSMGGYSRFAGHAVLRRGGLLYGRYF